MKRRIILIALWLAAVAWLVLCLYLSWQTGEKTSVGLSWKITQWCVKILNMIGLLADPQTLHMQIRLFAHFGIFFVSGILFSGAFAVTLRRQRNAILAALAVCIVFATLAEVCKLGIPGRHLQWDETGLNVSGAVVGILLVQIVYWLIRKRVHILKKEH